MKERGSWAMIMAVIAMGASACSSSDLVPPEPDIETAGSFIAVLGYEVENEISLIRMIDRLDFESDTLLFVTVYDVNPANWAEARELSKRQDLPLRVKIEGQFVDAIRLHPFRVVWFRTLTEMEAGRVP